MNITPIQSFLLTPTPTAWLDHAEQNIDILLLDHAQCEHKAAISALNLTYRFEQRPDIIQSLSRIAREELRHFEQVLNLIKKRKIKINHLIAPRYAKSLYLTPSNKKMNKLIDQLLIASIIEARSCERFHALTERLDDELASYYSKLYQAEFLHYQFFLELAFELKPDATERLDTLLENEKNLILSPENIFRFHSGIPSERKKITVS
jgi:tRNA 2-(methylsulfanyl)-N6-isopentenyladenosine37 hydroxylase